MPRPIKWQCRVAPSLGALEDTHKNVWHTKEYKDLDRPTVFFGLYGLPDFYTLWRHKGRKAILWAGSDIKHFINGYWLSPDGRIRLESESIAEWINKNCESYVENGVEHEALMVLGVESHIVPSFLGHTMNYSDSYTYRSDDRPQVYASVSGDNFRMYGWEQIELVADKCNVDFHLYGNTVEWPTKHHNVFVHGRVSKEQMNEEIRGMQAGLRPLEFDGFSEILAKSILWGQWPISRIAYPGVTNYTTNDELIAALNDLKNKKEPNREALKWFYANVNRYPWSHV